jgi:hypothetical protein
LWETNLLNFGRVFETFIEALDFVRHNEGKKREREKREEERKKRSMRMKKRRGQDNVALQARTSRLSFLCAEN